MCVDDDALPAIEPALDDGPIALLEGNLHRTRLEGPWLDFDEDLYGERARVRFVRRLRGEERFDSVDALVDQMGRDVAAARRALGR